MRRIACAACSVLGVAAAFGIVLAWFPRGGSVWNLPLQQIDAPAHYYFIRKILDQGLGAALRLWPNDAYYPPLFHLLVVAVIRVCALFGVHVNIYTAFNAVWLATSGILWPAGMQLLSTYWTRRVDSSRAGWRPFSCAMAVIVPVLSVASASHPFWMLFAGPLVAFGLATSLLPFWLYATLRLFDALAARTHVVRWLALTVLAGAVCMFAHPRIVFTWLLLMAPFMILRLPWRLIAALAGAVVAGALAFFVYMKATYRSTRYLDPGSWFHTFVPNHTVGQALWIVARDNIAGPSGVFMAAVVLASLGVLVFAAVRPTSVFADRSGSPAGPGGTRKDAVSLLLACGLVTLVYVCSTVLTGWFPNIVAAAWYLA